MTIEAKWIEEQTGAGSIIELVTFDSGVVVLKHSIFNGSGEVIMHFEAPLPPHVIAKIVELYGG